MDSSEGVGFERLGGYEVLRIKDEKIAKLEWKIKAIEAAYESEAKLRADWLAHERDEWRKETKKVQAELNELKLDYYAKERELDASKNRYTK